MYTDHVHPRIDERFDELIGVFDHEVRVKRQVSAAAELGHDRWTEGDVWNKMSPTQQAIMEEMAKAGTIDSMAYSESIQSKVMKANVEENGVKNMYWSDEMLAKFKAAWEEVAEEESAKDPFFKKVLDDLNAFRSEYQLWKDYAFLPRPKPNK